MNKWLFSAGALFLLCVSISAPWVGGGFLDSSLGFASPANNGSRVLESARDFFNSLSGEDQSKSVFAYGGTEHADWHFIPRARRGVHLGEMSPDSRVKLNTLLKRSVSDIGHTKVEQIRELEGILRLLEGPGRRFARDPQLYFVTFYGAPSETKEWAWRFEGHHLCLNFAFKGSQLISHTPAFYGANPTIVDAGPGRVLRVLAEEEELARQLLHSLDTAKRSRCLGEEVPEEVPSTAKASYDGPFPEGVAAANLNDFQKALLKKLIGVYIQNFRADVASREWEQFSAAGGIDKIHFAWRGELNLYEPHSYLIHGPTFVINYSNTQHNAAHIHSSFRRLEKDF